MVIGGREEKEGECRILGRLVDLAGGHAAHLLILTTAAEQGGRVGEEYRAIFRRLGASEVSVLHLNRREQANQTAAAETLRAASGIFFTGGDQLRITSTLGGTLVYETLHRRYQEGVVIAGTSAGASAMSGAMIVGGDGESVPHKAALQMVPGIGLLEEVVIDQHFAQRGRIGRLLAAVAQNPFILGVGVDEDTAMVVEPDGTFSVEGSATVTVVDGKTLTYSNASESRPDQPLALTNVTLHVLPRGYRFDLANRLPLPGGE